MRVALVLIILILNIGSLPVWAADHAPDPAKDPANCSKGITSVLQSYLGQGAPRSVKNQARMDRVLKAIESLPKPAQKDAYAFLRALPERHPFVQYLDSITPGRRNEMTRVLELALKDFGSAEGEATLMARASKDLSSLSVTERRALALLLQEKWWFQSGSESVSAISSVTERMRLTTRLDRAWSDGYSPLSPQQLESLLRGSFETDSWPGFFKQSFDRDATVQALARTILSSPVRGQEQLKEYFSAQRKELEQEVQRSSGFKRMHLSYLKQRLDQLDSYLSLPAEEWKTVVSKNPKYQQLLFEIAPLFGRNIESTMGGTIGSLPVLYLIEWKLRRDESRREVPLPSALPVSTMDSDAFFQADSSSPSDQAKQRKKQPESEKQKLIRKLNSGSMTQAEFDRELAKLQKN